jgi:hypothetical protein
VGYPPPPSGVHTVPQRGTARPPAGYSPSPSGVQPVPPVGYTPSPSGVPPFPRWLPPFPQWGTTLPPEKHIRPVPARELSYLLLPRALEVCTRLGKTSTGSFGASPRLPAGGRSHLSTSRERYLRPDSSRQEKMSWLLLSIPTPRYPFPHPRETDARSGHHAALTDRRRDAALESAADPAQTAGQQAGPLWSTRRSV